MLVCQVVIMFFRQVCEEYQSVCVSVCLSECQSSSRVCNRSTIRIVVTVIK